MMLFNAILATATSQPEALVTVSGGATVTFAVLLGLALAVVIGVSRELRRPATALAPATSPRRAATATPALAA